MNERPPHASPLGPMEVLSVALKRERERVGLSVSELAKRAGLAKSTLSQLENGMGNPSLETIWSLATTLGVPFSRLVERRATPLTIIRAGEGQTAHSRAGNYAATLLHAGAPGAQRDLYRITIQPGETYTSHAHAVGVIEHVVIATGRAMVGPSSGPVELAPGDYLSYPADEPHIFKALEPDTTAVVVIES